MRTYPNLLWIGFSALVSVFLFWFSLSLLAGLFGLQLPFLIPNSGDTSWPETDTLILLLAFITVMIFMGAYNLWKVSTSWVNVRLQADGLTVFRPMKFTSKFVEWRDLVGFSTSQYYIGGSWNKSDTLWCSDSIILYTSDNGSYEVIRLYNYGLDDLTETLRKMQVEEFAFEPFNTTGFLIKHRTFEHKQQASR